MAVASKSKLGGLWVQTGVELPRPRDLPLGLNMNLNVGRREEKGGRERKLMKERLKVSVTETGNM